MQGNKDDKIKEEDAKVELAKKAVTTKRKEISDLEKLEICLTEIISDYSLANITDLKALRIAAEVATLATLLPDRGKMAAPTTMMRRSILFFRTSKLVIYLM